MTRAAALGLAARLVFGLSFTLAVGPGCEDRAAPTSAQASPSPPALPKPEPKPEPEPERQAPPASPPPCELVDPPPGFVDLAKLEPALHFAAGYHGPANFTGAQLPGYEAPGAWLEREAAQALAAAATELAKDDLHLLIFDAYRPRRASVAMVDWARGTQRESLLREGWIAARSAHNLGLAVDLALADAAGEALDMGSAWDHFGPESHLRGVDGPALERRLRLRAAMVRAGFVPYQKEWWHFSRPSDETQAARDRPYACR